MNRIEQKKRRQIIKIVLMELLMVLSVVVIVVVATLASLGFFVSSDGAIEQSGLAQIHSIPTGASVNIDGETLFSRTNLSRTMPEGVHSIKISRDKYDSWENQIQMKAGVLLRLYYPRLFLLNRAQKEVQTFENELAFYEPSANRNSILYSEKDSTTWYLMDIRGDEVKTLALEMAEILPYVKEGKFLGKVEKITWGRSPDHVIAKVSGDEGAEWILVNLKNLKNSLNLTRTFGMNFERVEMADGSAGKLFVLENQNLRRINTADQEISRVLLANVADFANNDGNMIYVTNLKNDTEVIKQIGVYRDGEKGGTILATVADDVRVKVAISMYYGDYYLSYTVGDKMTVRFGALPAYNETSSDLSGLKDLLSEEQIGFVPESLSSSPSDSYVVAQNGKRVVVVSFENSNLYDYELPTTSQKWLTEDILYTTSGGGLVVWDFDNTNQRELVVYRARDELGAVGGMNQKLEKDESGISSVSTVSTNALTGDKVTIAENNKWMYYAARDSESGKLILMREMIRE